MNRNSRAPGEAVPDVHPCEQAIRDLEALEWLRARKGIGDAVSVLEREREEWREWPEAGRVEMLDALITLLQPGEVRRDPAFVLAAAQDLLDDANNAGRGRLHMDVSGVPVGSLLDAYNALLAARKPAGEEGG